MLQGGSFFKAFLKSSVLFNQTFQFSHGTHVSVRKLESVSMIKLALDELNEHVSSVLASHGLKFFLVFL
jgi:hypothetical protein